MKSLKAEQFTKAKIFTLPNINSNAILMPADSKNPLPNNKTNDRALAWCVAKNLFASFKYAWAGISYTFTTQRNFRIHTVVAVLVVSLGVYLGITAVKMAIVTLTCALVMILELLNTAIESVVDLTVKQNYHELAKIAKDCAAGAVLVSAGAAVVVAGFILLPPLLDYFN